MNKLYSMQEINEGIQLGLFPEKFDYLFCAANYDKRTYNAFNLLEKSNIIADNKIVLDYDKLRPEDNQNGQSQAFIDYQKYTLLRPTHIQKCSNSDDDVKYINSLNIAQNTTIGIDITGLTIPDIFRMLYVLKELKGVRTLHVFYTEPQHYVFDNDTFNQYTHLSGEKLYKPIEEYYITGVGPELLIFFLGFDSGVSNYIFEKAQPQETIIINGFPSYVPKLKDISLLNNYSLITSSIDTDHRYFTQANNPFSAYNVLCDIVNKYHNYLINICVLGTKPMALGAGIFSLDNLQRVKVTYPYPQKYISNNTVDMTTCWHYIIEF